MVGNLSQHRHLPLPPNSSSSPSLAHHECVPPTKPTNSDEEHPCHPMNVLFREAHIHLLDTSTDHRLLMRILRDEILRSSRRPPTALLSNTIRHIDTRSQNLVSTLHQNITVLLFLMHIGRHASTSDTKFQELNLVAFFPVVFVHFSSMCYRDRNSAA